MTAVKKISSSNGVSLVEWIDNDDGSVRRSYVPTDKIENDAVQAEILSVCIPHGIDWDYVLSDYQSRIDSLSAILRKRGLWTFQDVSSNPQAVFAALQECYALDYQAIVKLARQYQITLTQEVTNGR